MSSAAGNKGHSERSLPIVRLKGLHLLIVDDSNRFEPTTNPTIRSVNYKGKVYTRPLVLSPYCIPFPYLHLG